MSISFSVVSLLCDCADLALISIIIESFDYQTFAGLDCELVLFLNYSIFLEIMVSSLCLCF